MKQYIKRYLAVIMAVAMVVSLLPASMAEAAGGTARAAGTTESVPCSKFVVSGKQSGNPTDSYVIATNANGSNGTATEAAYIQGETANKKEGALGAARVGGIAFAVPQDYLQETGAKDPDLIVNATVTINVPSVNGNMGDDKETKAGLFLVDASKYDTMASEEANNAAPTYPAVDGNYSKAATVFSNEMISKASLGKKTFDVTEWVKRGIKKKDSYVIFRLQTVISGFYVNYQGSDAPTLSLTTLTEQEAVDQAVEEIEVLSVLTDKMELPTTGLCASTIAWMSDNEAFKNSRSGWKANGNIGKH